MEQQKLVQELDSFKKDLVLNYSLREVTINGHLGNIRRMLQKLKTENPEKEDVINYVYFLKQSKKSCSHISNNLASIEKYMDFKRKLLRFAKPRRPKTIIKEILTEGEINRILSSCKDIKEKAMITILAYSGIRNKSLCDLKLKDIDVGNNNILVRKPKGRKQYYANIPSECVRVILDYLDLFPKRPDDYLFTTWVKNNKYSPSDIRKIVNTLAKRIGMEKSIYPHLFRHSLASNMLNRGAGIILIKEQLGHDHLESTMIYLNSFPQRIKSEYEIYKPSYL